MHSQKLLTVVICTYNGAAHLEEVLRAVLSQDCFGQYVEAIVVVDNNSTDKTREVALRLTAEFPVIEYRLEERQGLSFARRHAARCQSPWVAFLDDDNIVASGWLIAIARTIEANPHAGIINGAVIPMPNEAYTPQEKAMLQAFYRDLACTHLTMEASRTEAGTGRPVGAGMCVLTGALKKIDAEGWLKLVGRQGELLFSGEDGELAYRVQKQGYGFVFNPEIKLYHIIPPSRLTEKYMQRLFFGLVADSYRYISMKPCYVLQRILRVTKYCVQIVCCKIISLLTQNRVRQLVCRYTITNCQQFIRIACRDKFFRRDV